MGLSSDRARALAYFVGQGWTTAQSAGVVANLVAESNLNPSAVGDGGAAYGIAQWHGDRQRNFAAVMGKDIHGSSLDDQLAFVHAELVGTERRAGDALLLCDTAAQAGATVSKQYERPADSEGEATRRAALAEELLAQMGEIAAPAPPPTSPTPDAAEAQPVAQEAKPMAALIPFLLQLLPSVVGLFQPKIQQAVQKISGQPAEVAGPFVVDMFSKMGQAVGLLAAPSSTTPSGEQIANQQQAVQIAGAMQTAQADQIKSVEDHLAKYFDQVNPVIDKLRDIDRDQAQFSREGRDAAAARIINLGGGLEVLKGYIANVDSLTRWMVGALSFSMLIAMIAKPIGAHFDFDVPDWVPMILPVLSMVVGQIMGERKAINGFLTDGTPTSNAAAAANQAIATASNTLQRQ